MQLDPFLSSRRLSGAKKKRNLFMRHGRKPRVLARASEKGIQDRDGQEQVFIFVLIMFMLIHGAIRKYNLRYLNSADSILEATRNEIAKRGHSSFHAFYMMTKQYATLKRQTPNTSLSCRFNCKEPTHRRRTCSNPTSTPPSSHPRSNTQHQDSRALPRRDSSTKRASWECPSTSISSHATPPT